MLSSLNASEAGQRMPGARDVRAHGEFDGHCGRILEILPWNKGEGGIHASNKH